MLISIVLYLQIICKKQPLIYFEMKKLVSGLLMATLAVSLFSCSTDSEMNEQPQVAVVFNPVHGTLDSQRSQLKLSEGNISFTSGHIAISRLEFEAETENDSLEIEFDLKQNTLIDFATGNTTPDISAISIPAGIYEEIEVEIELRESSEVPAIVLDGTYVAPDGQSHSIRFEFNSEETFEVEREGMIVFEESQTAITQITFAPAVWFAGVTDEAMVNATKDADGVIVISSDHNPEIFDVVADGLDLASDLEIEDED